MVDLLTGWGAGVGRLRERMAEPGQSLHAPHLLDVEVLYVLRRASLQGNLSSERGREALEDLAALRISRYAHSPFAGRIWELRENVSAYDAAYLALAEALEAPLITRDTRLARAPGAQAEIEVLP